MTDDISIRAKFRKTFVFGQVRCAYGTIREALTRAAFFTEQVVVA
jgi:hypothetical protein